MQRADNAPKRGRRGTSPTMRGKNLASAGRLGDWCSPLAGITKKALMVHGGWEGHEPRQCVERFVPFLESQGFAVELSGSLEV